MRKERVKALKEAFQKREGRLPRKIQVIEREAAEGVAYLPSEVRRIKKAYLAERRKRAK